MLNLTIPREPMEFAVTFLAKAIRFGKMNDGIQLEKVWRFSRSFLGIAIVGITLGMIAKPSIGS